MRIVPAIMVVLSLSLGAVAAPPTASKDIDVLSRRVIEPISTQELHRSMSPTHLRRQSRQEQPLSATETRVSYTYSVQLPDGSLMQVPESYKVTQTGQHQQRGVYKDLTVYSVRREGSRNELVEIGLTPSDTVVVLSPNSHADDILSPQPQQ